MSDQNPFGGPGTTAVAEPGTEETPEVSNRPKPIVFIVGGAVLLVLAAAAYFLLFSGGGSDDSSAGGAVVPSKAHVSTAPSAKTVPSSAPSVVAAGGLTGSGTDPFRAAPSASSSASGAPSASGTASGSTGGSGSTSGVTSTLTVNSVNFAGNSANVTVDGKSYVAHAGAETFATYYQLRVVIQGSAQCAVFVFGDLPAQLCKGQSATFKG